MPTVSSIKKLEEDFKLLTKNGTLFHAYLFFGGSIENIFNFSLMFANFLENSEFKIADKFLNDLSVIKPNEHNNIGIDEVREIQKFLYQSPIISKKRVVIVYKADTLTNEAQSGILKIIEEPPKNSLIILVAGHEDTILETLRSRMHKIYFPTPELVGKKSGKKSESENKIDETDEIMKKNLIDLGKNLRQNSGTIKEVLERFSLMKQYNLNDKLQLRLLSEYLKRKK